MKYIVAALALCGLSALAHPAHAQDANTLVGSGTHLKGNGSGPDGLGTSGGTPGAPDSGPKVAPSVLGGETSGVPVTSSGTPASGSGAATGLGR